MGGEFRRLEFGISMRDYEHWSPDEVARAYDTPGDGMYDGPWQELVQVAERAILAHLAEHPTVFYQWVI